MRFAQRHDHLQNIFTETYSSGSLDLLPYDGPPTCLCRLLRPGHSRQGSTTAHWEIKLHFKAQDDSDATAVTACTKSICKARGRRNRELAAVILYRVHEVRISHGLYEGAKPCSKSLRVICKRHHLILPIHSHEDCLPLQAGRYSSDIKIAINNLAKRQTFSHYTSTISSQFRCVSQEEQCNQAAANKLQEIVIGAVPEQRR